MVVSDSAGDTSGDGVELGIDEVGNVRSLRRFVVGTGEATLGVAVVSDLTEIKLLASSSL